MKRGSRLSVLGLALAAPLLVSGCILQFTNGAFQSFTLHFKLSKAIPAGESTLVQTTHHPDGVVIKKRWVQVSGMLTAPEGEELPDSVAVKVRVENASGKATLTLSTTLEIGEDGSFKKSKKFKKNVPEDGMVFISVDPKGGALASAMKVWLCVDIVKQKADLKNLPECGDGDDGGANVVIVNILDNFFDPQQVTIQPGDTVRWVLKGNDLSHTTTATGTWDSSFVFNVQGASFERTFPQGEDGQTFQYSCVTHQACCQMQGSVLVGENAPSPSPGY